MFGLSSTRSKLKSISKTWAKVTGVDPGDKGQILTKAESYVSNIGCGVEDAWLIAFMNWMDGMPWADSKSLLARALLDFLEANEKKNTIAFSGEYVGPAFHAAIALIGESAIEGDPHALEQTQIDFGLVRTLLKKRIEGDPQASNWTIDARLAEILSDVELVGIPEGTIVTIVATYALLKGQGLDDRKIFGQIEAHRSMIGSGPMPEAVTLETYVQYRVDLENEHGALIKPQFVSEAVRIARGRYKC